MVQVPSKAPSPTACPGHIRTPMKGDPGQPAVLPVPTGPCSHSKHFHSGRDRSRTEQGGFGGWSRLDVGPTHCRTVLPLRQTGAPPHSRTRKPSSHRQCEEPRATQEHITGCGIHDQCFHSSHYPEPWAGTPWTVGSLRTLRVAHWEGSCQGES